MIATRFDNFTISPLSHWKTPVGLVCWEQPWRKKKKRSAGSSPLLLTLLTPVPSRVPGPEVTSERTLGWICWRWLFLFLLVNPKNDSGASLFWSYRSSILFRMFFAMFAHGATPRMWILLMHPVPRVLSDMWSHQPLATKLLNAAWLQQGVVPRTACAATFGQWKNPGWINHDQPPVYW